MAEHHLDEDWGDENKATTRSVGMLFDEPTEHTVYGGGFGTSMKQQGLGKERVFDNQGGWGSIGTDPVGISPKTEGYNLEIVHASSGQKDGLGEIPPGSFDDDFMIDLPFPDFEDVGPIIDVSQSSFMPSSSYNQDPNAPPMLPAFFVRPSCYTSKLTPDEMVGAIEKVAQSKHYDIQKSGKWTFSCSAYNSVDECTFVVQVWASEFSPDECVMELNKMKGDSIFYTRVMSEFVYSLPSECGLEPYAEDVGMPLRPDELPSPPSIDEFDEPITLTDEAIERVGELCKTRYLEPQTEGLHILAQLASSEENQRILAKNEFILSSLRQSLDSASPDRIQRLCLEVWRNIFKVSDHREIAAEDPTFMERMKHVLESTQSNEIKFLVSQILELLATSHPSLVFNTGVSIYEEQMQGCSDGRVQNAFRRIMDLQIVA